MFRACNLNILLINLLNSIGLMNRRIPGSRNLRRSKFGGGREKYETEFQAVALLLQQHVEELKKPLYFHYGFLKNSLFLSRCCNGYER